MMSATRRPRLRVLLMAGASFAVCASPAWAQASDNSGPPSLQAPSGSLLPPLGADPTSPGLRDQLMDVFGLNQPGTPSAASTGPGWQFKPQITVSEEFTDNVGAAGGPNLGVNGRRGSDFITLVQPSVTVINTSDRVRVNLNYAPTAQIYAENFSFSQVRQQGTGDVLTTLLPDLFYFDLRGSISQQPVYGGFGAVNIDTLPPDQQETLSSFSATPYVAHSFGGFGTAQAGVGYVYSATDAPDYLNANRLPQIGFAGNYGSSWLATKRIFASFSTGEDFARFQNVLGTDTSFYDGSGALKSAQRVTVTDDASYAVNRFVSVLGEIGYENLSYPNAGFAYVGGVWAGGVRLTPNKDSSVTLQYRYIDGTYAPYIYGSWQATPRLRLFGGYSEGITSFEQDQQNTLLSGDQTQTGASASALVAAPVQSNANYFGGNQALNRSRRLNFTAAYVADRDTITASFDWQRSTQVGNPQGLSSSLLAQFGLTPQFLTYVLLNGIPPYIQGFTRTLLQQILQFEHLTSNATSNLVGGLTWSHDLSPDLSASLYGGYSRSKQAYTTNVTQSTALVSASLNYRFTETLSGRAIYSGHYVLDDANNNFGNYNGNDTTFTVSLTKTF